jgi:predicted nucleic acid-binding protein
VVSEVVYVLTSRIYRVPRQEVRDSLEAVLELPGVKISAKPLLLAALDLWMRYPIGFDDAFQVAEMQATGLDEISSYDRGFDRVDRIARIEPA